MKILLIEPYYTGSHKVWADGYMKYSKHTIERLTLEGRHWKWRMHGAAIELANRVNALYKEKARPDLMLVSDMVDLTTFISLLDRSLRHIPTAFYFHENQLSYPYTDKDTDSKRVRDFHYGFINYTSALASDQVFFNSKAQMQSFFLALETLLKRMPDYRGLDTVASLKEKTSVLPLGIEFPKFHYGREHQSLCSQLTHPDWPTILWTHRWEYDKNPNDFFKALYILSEEGLNFNLAVLGAESKKPPEIFKEAKTKLEKHIVAFGKPKTYEMYVGWLFHADILPVTSKHETFGISFMEAIHCGVQPLLPKRLSYPELVCPDRHPDFFYADQDDLVDKLRHFLLTYKPSEKSQKQDHLRHITAPYDWPQMHEVYDRTLLAICK